MDGNGLINAGGGANSIDGGKGNDKILTLSGNDTILGGSGDDSLDASGGINSIDGGNGFDTLTLPDFNSATAASTITNLSNSIVLPTGTWSVSSIERFADLRTGSCADNINAGLGQEDTVNGGTGSDVLVVDYLSNSYFNGSGIGIPSGLTMFFDNPNLSSYSGAIGAYYNKLGSYDRVQFSNIEHFQITGTAAKDAIVGGVGNDTFNGWLRADSLTGGNGSDTYVVDNVGDLVVETNALAAGGSDTVLSSLAAYTLTANVENLSLTGVTDISGTGNTLGNLITGNSGANVLNGAAANYTLTGGLGGDTYRFDSALNASTNLDVITNFDIAQGDIIQLENSIFAAFTTTDPFAASAFFIGAAAETPDQFILYNSTTGLLSYDKDGSEVGFSSIAFATLTLTPGQLLTNTSFTIT